MRTFTRPVLMVDTREQRPLTFEPYADQFQHIVRASLPAGDYAVFGTSRRIVFERKSLEDLIGTVTRGRERFERELEKLKEFDYAAIIIESSYGQVAGPYSFSRTNPNSVIGTLQAYQLRYDVDVIFTGSRANSERFIFEKIMGAYNAEG